MNETSTDPLQEPAPVADDTAAPAPTATAPSAPPAANAADSAPAQTPAVVTIALDDLAAEETSPQTAAHMSVPARYLDAALTAAREHPNAVIFGSGVVFALVVLWLVARARKAELGLFRNPAGRVSVSRNALSDLVETVARGVPGTVKPRAYFRKRGGLLNVKLRLRLKGRRRLTGFVSDLQERITAALRDALGDEQVGQVDIIVTGFYDLGTREQPEDKDAPETEPDDMKDVM